MNEQLKRVAHSGIFAIVYLALSALFFQHFWMLARKSLAYMDVNLYELNVREMTILTSMGACICILIGLLAYSRLERAYLEISGFKKTKNAVLWGMVGARLGIVICLIGLVRYFMLGCESGGFGPKASLLSKTFVLFDCFKYVALCMSFLLLQRAVVKNAFLRAMCIAGAIGWLVMIFVDLKHPLDFSQEIVSWHSRYASHFRVRYVVEAILLLPFLALMFNEKHASLLEDDDDEVDDQAARRAMWREFWANCAMPLLVLGFVAVPLCCAPFLVTYRFFSNSLFHMSFRINVLVFKLFCVLMGAFMGMGAFQTLRSYLRRANFNKMVQQVKDGIGNSVKSFSFKRFARRAPSGPKSEKRPEKISSSARGRLLEIRQLLDDGLITQAEYDQKRANILAEL